MSAPRPRRSYSTSRFLVIYFVGTVAGFYMSAIEYRAPSIGASAGIMGLIGAMIAFGVTNRTSMGRAVRSLYIRWVVYIFVFGFLMLFHR